MNPIRKIVVTGPESTGKTTTSRALAEALQTVWVPEYAREYLERISRPYQETDLLSIAKGQIEKEEQQIPQARDLLICDTDLYVIKIWSESRYHHCDRWILEQIAQRTYDLYLLSYIDLEWEPDPLREHPDPRDRQYFYQTYLDHLAHSGVPFVVLSGSAESRLQQALTAIDRINKP